MLLQQHLYANASYFVTIVQSEQAFEKWKAEVGEEDAALVFHAYIGIGQTAGTERTDVVTA